MPSSAEIIFTDEDLLSEILSYVPVKPLLRFKSVSKQWNSLISDPHFSLLHCRRHPRAPASGLFFLRHHPSLFPFFHFIPLSPPSHPPPLSPHHHILQSSNGLILFPSSLTSFCVCNPTINHRAIIQLPQHVNHDSFLGLSLAFDPSRSPHYQLVCVSKTRVDEGALYAICVFSSGTHQWRRVTWLSETQETVFLDLERDCVETLMLPNLVEDYYLERFRYFGESCGHLHLIEIRPNCVQDFDVFELDKRDKTHWLVKYRVNLFDLGRGFEADIFPDNTDRFPFYTFSILAVVRAKEGDDEDDDGGWAMIISIPGKVISYDFTTKMSKLICSVVDKSHKWFPLRRFIAVQFIENLYSVCE